MTYLWRLGTPYLHLYAKLPVTLLNVDPDDLDGSVELCDALCSIQSGGGHDVLRWGDEVDLDGVCLGGLVQPSPERSLHCINAFVAIAGHLNVCRGREGGGREGRGRGEGGEREGGGRGKVGFKTMLVAGSRLSTCSNLDWVWSESVLNVDHQSLLFFFILKHTITQHTRLTAARRIQT